MMQVDQVAFVAAIEMVAVQSLCSGGDGAPQGILFVGGLYDQAVFRSHQVQDILHENLMDALPIPEYQAVGLGE